MSDIFRSKKTTRTAVIYSLIAKVKDEKKRNLLRGYSAQHQLSNKDVESARNGNSAHDSVIVGSVLKGIDGLLQAKDKSKKRTSGDLFTLTNIPPVDWRSEVRYTAGYINSTCIIAKELLAVIRSLAQLETIDTIYALKLLLNLSKEHGASNFLSHKLAYLKSSRNISAKESVVITEIENVISHRLNPGLLFSALENISPKVSLFVVAQRCVSGLVGEIGGNFRSAVSLSNFIPTPLDHEDVAGFLLRATESSLLDTIYSTIVIFNLTDDFQHVRSEFEAHLDPLFKESLLSLIEFLSKDNSSDIITDLYQKDNEGGNPTLDLYRVSSAFLERPKLTNYRNMLDQVFGARMLEEVIDRDVTSFSKPFSDRELLLARDAPSLADDHQALLDSFYRTYLFLKFISNRNNLLNLAADDIKFIFENTSGLDILLTEEEMETLTATASPESKSLVTVLSLALFRRKSIDPDIDYKYRANFISHVKSMHEGSITNFINSLLTDSPGVASYIVDSLDEVTLEKLYTLVKNATEASDLRVLILRSLGQKLNRIEYFIEADEITTRTKVSGLMQYFDSSRIYVDSVSMKKWLDSNPTMAAQEYRALYTKIEAKFSNIEHEINGIDDPLVIRIVEEHLYLVKQIAEDAFKQFCLNTEFGIESYLGRRIRHNTLDGVTTDTVDAVLRKNIYKAVVTNPTVGQTIEIWLATYKSIIDKLRNVHLQFRRSSSLFKSSLDLEDATTMENIRKLSITLGSGGGSELLNDLVIAFCWQQITPQLENAARFIKTALLQEAKASIDKSFSGHCSATEEQMKAELHEAVNEVFKKIADWFQAPQTGFVTASLRDLCQIILLELNLSDKVVFSGDAIDTSYTGISVHRLYDCLAVLLQNANKHGEDRAVIHVKASATRVRDESTLHKVTVDVKSKVEKEQYASSKERLFRAIDSAETGIDMVTEGYTGIKKIKFITRASEGIHTITCQHNDSENEFVLSFTLHAETGLAILKSSVES